MRKMTLELEASLARLREAEEHGQEQDAPAEPAQER